MNLEIKGFNKLVDCVVCLEKQGVSPSVTLLSGVFGIRHGLFIVKHKGNIILESYGLSQVFGFIKDNLDIVDDVEIKYITVTKEQLDVCVFDVWFESEDKELIKTVMKLSTGCGERVVCGEGCELHCEESCMDTHNEHDLEDIVLGENGDEGEDTPEEITEDTQEPATEEAEIQEDTSENPSGSSDDVDWEYVDAMYDETDKHSSKVSLEEYALAFGVELKKNTTYEKMVVTFKQEMGVE